LGEQLLILADRFSQRTGVRCSLTESGEARPPSAAQRNALRFALQEALTNAYRHGQARHIWATLEWNREEVSLRVRDNGSASNAAAGEGGGQGLRGMRERAAALGGTSSAGPSDEGGFVVIVTLPLAADEANTLAKDA
jgi:signal transduction histidine kinase